MRKRVKSFLSFVVLIIVVVVLAACAEKSEPNPTTVLQDTQQTVGNPIAGGASIRLDYESNPYMVLVNKQNKLPDNWESKIVLVDATNTFGDQNKVEKEAYVAFLELKEDLLKNDGIHIELDSAYRSIEDQKKTVEYFLEKKGQEYVDQFIAVPGYSEHHTGLALDIYLVDPDGTEIFENDDMLERVEEFEKIHAKIANYGFILRYIKGKEDITGYNYEPWHLRFINDIELAKEITEKGVTFEEFLGK